jgi:diacylglycerol O-acyltransferase
MSRLERVAHAAAMSAPMGASMLTGHARRRPIYNVVISNVPGPKDTLYLDGMRLDETYPVSIPVDYLALNITIAGYAGRLGFGFVACRRSVPALQRMLDHTDESLAELEAAVA